MDDALALVAVPHCHWTDGTWVDLVKVGARAREVGAVLAVDATQSLGALPLNVAEVQPDYLVAAGYKWLMGPYSQGYLYVAPRHREGQPLELNWITRRGQRGLLPARRLQRRVPARRAPLRHGRAQQLHPGAHGAGRPAPAARLGCGVHPGDAARADAPGGSGRGVTGAGGGSRGASGRGTSWACAVAEAIRPRCPRGWPRVRSTSACGETTCASRRTCTTLRPTWIGCWRRWRRSGGYRGRSSFTLKV